MKSLKNVYTQKINKLIFDQSFTYFERSILDLARSCHVFQFQKLVL